MKWERFSKEAPSWQEAESKDKLELEQIRMFQRLIEPMMDSLVAQVKPDVESGRWGVVLGDDRGARLPALAMREILANAARDNNAKTPDTFFVAAGVSRQGAEYENNLKQRIAALKELIGNERVLLVTDHIDSGKTIQRLSDLLQENEIQFDVVSLSRKITKGDHPTEEDVVDVDPLLPPGSKFFVGKDKSDDGMIFWIRMQEYFMEDYKKRDDVGLNVSGNSAIASRDTEADPAFLATARELNKEMADRLYEKHFKNGTNN